VCTVKNGVRRAEGLCSDRAARVSLRLWPTLPVMRSRKNPSVRNATRSGGEERAF
jgi:hypothetical protein